MNALLFSEFLRPRLMSGREANMKKRRETFEREASDSVQSQEVKRRNGGKEDVAEKEGALFL